MPEFIRSEDEFLRLLDLYFNLSSTHQLSLRGDDCVELSMPEEICLSSDLFLEDIHFRTAYFSYYEIGRKALAVNLSDLASAGAMPLGFNMNLILPATTPRQDVEQLLMGMGELAADYHLPLTGGDLSKGDKLGICISIWGEKKGKRFLRRAECRPGDILFLAGDSFPLPLGMARMGLDSLEKFGREKAIARAPQSCIRHLLPSPLLAAGAAIAQLDPEASLIDVSDGLARDLPRLLGQPLLGLNGGNTKQNEHRTADAQTSITGTSDNFAAKLTLGAELTISEQNLCPELLVLCSSLKLNPIEQAVLGGEDYLLLGSTGKPEILPELETETGASYLIIGKVTEEESIILNGVRLMQTGFDHFSG